MAPPFPSIPTNPMKRTDSEETTKLDAGWSKRSRYWPETRIGMLSSLDVPKLVERWCHKSVWDHPNGVPSYYHDMLPVMLRRIMNPICCNPFEFYADRDLQPMECLATFASKMGYESHPAFNHYEVEEFTIGSEQALKYALWREQVRTEWVGKCMIAIVRKKDKCGLRVQASNHEDAVREYLDNPDYTYVFLFLLNYIRNFASKVESDMKTGINKINAAFDDE